jgi:hypothetical protein
MRSSDPFDPRAVLGAVKARPGNGSARWQASTTAGLDRACARRINDVRAGTKERPQGTNKGTRQIEGLDSPN